jgi:hypothetical protein
LEIFSQVKDRTVIGSGAVTAPGMAPLEGELYLANGQFEIVPVVMQVSV